LDGINSYDNI